MQTPNEVVSATHGVATGLLWLGYALLGLGIAPGTAVAQYSETVLYAFMGGADGGAPFAGVIRDLAGNLYGTTYFGGAYDAGVVYALNPAGQETVLYNFTGGDDGGNPYAGVIRDAAGNLYGTTSLGGKSGYGVIYELNPAGQETVLYNFRGGADGRQPSTGVIRDAAGNLYGVTEFGGKFNQGVVYKLDPAGRETVLHTFTAGADGGYPSAGVIGDSAGNLYGTAQKGGTFNAGVVFKLNPASQETVLYSFTGLADGAYPIAGLVRDSAGNLYGTTNLGGQFARGAVFKLNPAGQETVLYSFTLGADGNTPFTGLIQGPAGNLCGTTYYGGKFGYGVVYGVNPAGQQAVIYSFTSAADGGNTASAVVADSVGNLYGTAYNGGTGRGVVFKLTPP